MRTVCLHSAVSNMPLVLAVGGTPVVASAVAAMPPAAAAAAAVCVNRVLVMQAHAQ